MVPITRDEAMSALTTPGAPERRAGKRPLSVSGNQRRRAPSQREAEIERLI